jgi:hypothetical protein
LGNVYWYLAGIPANINFEDDPGPIFAALKIGGFGTIACAVGGLLTKSWKAGVVFGILGSLFGGYFLVGDEFFLKAHSINDFTDEQIRNVMDRIQKNYKASPFMGLQLLGRLRPEEG